MKEVDIKTIIEVCLLNMEGESAYEILFQNPIHPELSRIGLELATYLRYLIYQFENENKIKSQEA